VNVLAANLETADKRSFDHGQLNIVVLDGIQLARAVFNPGWRWSIDVGPQAGTATCQARHAGIVLSGRFGVRMDDGTQVELGPGDAHIVAPGHDAWVVGDEQCVLVDIGPAPVPGAGPEEVVHQYFAAFNAGSVVDVLACFTEDAVVAADGLPTAAGAAALRGTYEGFFGGMRVTEQESIDRSSLGADVAVISTHSTGELTNRATGERSRLRLRELFGLRRTAAGWRISEYTFNSDPGRP
jgi:ketosteroid isomerase-like protein